MLLNTSITNLSVQEYYNINKYSALVQNFMYQSNADLGTALRIVPREQLSDKVVGKTAVLNSYHIVILGDIA